MLMVYWYILIVIVIVIAIASQVNTYSSKQFAIGANTVYSFSKAENTSLVIAWISDLIPSTNCLFEVFEGTVFGDSFLR